MKQIKKYFCVVVIISVFTILTACGTVNNLRETENEQSSIELEKETEEILTFEAGDFEGYMNFIANVENFEPCYRTVFAFENVPDGIDGVPIEEVNAMYREIEDVFDYILINEHFLTYHGDYNQGVYKGNTNFVNGYDAYEAANGNISSPINYKAVDWEGNEFTATSLKAIQLGEGICKGFDEDIAEGRNLQQSDFILKASDDLINVVLGNKYKELFKIGDTFSLEFGNVMNFQVVGFYKPDISFSMDIGAQHKVNFDYAIVMPHLIFDYKPTDEGSRFQQGFLTGEKLSGYIAIKKSTKEINEDTYKEYTEALEKIAKKNGVSGLYKVPYWPVGFVW